MILKKRLQELNSPTNIPLSYRCYAVYEVNNPLKLKREFTALSIELTIHYMQGSNLIMVVLGKRIFKISPETAYGVFKDIAILRNDLENLKLYTPTLSQSQEEELAESRTKRSNNSFKLLNIKIGERINFLYDENIVAKVSSDKNRVEFNGETYSVTALAIKILVEKYGWAENSHVNGWRYFTKDGLALSDLRDRIESTETDE